MHCVLDFGARAEVGPNGTDEKREMIMIKTEEDLKLFQHLRALRHQLHAHPELSARETETTAFLKKELVALGLELPELGLSTGVVAVLRGKMQGPTVGLRADIDALPVKEKTGAACASQNSGVMHACGHDIHTTALLGAAALLCRCREHLCGQIILIFQPAEETVDGARSIIASKLFEKYQLRTLLCLHVWPGMPEGTVGLRSGAFLSAVDSFQITITGQGGHGSMPHTAVNPIPAGAALALAEPSLVSYDLPPAETAAVSVCSLQAGCCDNAIPDTCTLLGTARTFSNAARQAVLRRLQALTEGTAAAYRCGGEVRIDHSIPPVVNHPVLADIMRRSAEKVLGQGSCRTMEPVMISEDFAYYGAHVPVCCALFGVGTGELLHSPSFFPPDSVLLPAAAFLAESALQMLNDKNLPLPERKENYAFD